MIDIPEDHEMISEFMELDHEVRVSVKH